MNLDDLFDDYKFTNTELKCDIYERNNKYIIEMDLPGYKKEEIKVEVVNDILSVSVNEKEEDNRKIYLKKERVHKKQERTFSLGKVKINEIDARLEDGVLIVVIPKKGKELTRRIIEIK